MKKLYVILFIFSLFSLGMASDDDFDEFKKQTNQGFAEFKSEQDKQFYEYLKTSWEEFKSFKAQIRDEHPKLKKAPEAPISKSTDTVIINKEEAKIVKNMSRLKENKAIVPEEVSIKKEIEIKDNAMDFFGLALSVGAKNYGSLITLPVKTEKIAQAWKILATSDSDILLKQIKENGSKYNFTDWSYFKLIRSIAEQMYPDNDNEKALYSWFLLSKLGYEIKIGYNNENIFLLVPSKQTIYGKQFFKFNDIKYYVLWPENKNVTTLYSYNFKYEKSDKIFTFNIENTIKAQYDRKELSFTYNGEDYIIPVEYDIFNVKFYKDFPQTDLNVYYRADVSRHLVNSVIENLRTIVKGKSEPEAVDIILRFVQVAFKYKTDQDQFGYEKYLLPDETVYYPYSDCEDRSILFSYLVRNILGLKTVMLEYPGHVAVAVKFNEDIVGDKLKIGEEIYVICDPTYINANIGMAMPQFKNVIPKVIN